METCVTQRTRIIWRKMSVDGDDVVGDEYEENEENENGDVLWKQELVSNKRTFGKTNRHLF